MTAWGYVKIEDSLIKNFLLKLVGIPHPYGRFRVKNVLKYLNFNAKKTLDLGSGEGIWAMELSKRGMNVVGLELSADSISNANQLLESSGLKTKIVQGDARKLQFKDNSFDQIICLDVLEHIEDPSKVFKEVSRCLKKDGQFIITVPNELYLVNSVLPLNLNEHAKAMGHVGAGINYEELLTLIEKNGLRLVQYNYFGKIFSRIIY